MPICNYKNKTEKVKPTINAMESKQTHFKFGFQQQKFETSYDNNLNKSKEYLKILFKNFKFGLGKQEVVKNIPSSTDNTLNQNLKDLEKK